MLATNRIVVVNINLRVECRELASSFSCRTVLLIKNHVNLLQVLIDGSSVA